MKGKSWFWQDAMVNNIQAVLIGVGILLSNSPALAVVCPTPPIILVDSDCEMSPTSIVNVTTASGIVINLSGNSNIIANGITANLGAATTTGALIQAGSTMTFNGSILKTSSTTTATSAAQTGLRAIGGGKITASNSSITMGPANSVTSASNLSGVKAESGGILIFEKTTIDMHGGAAGLNNVAVTATGTGSQVSLMGGSISTISRASYGVFAQNGGIVTLDGTQITTTGAGAAAVAGSHALYALGSGSKIGANNVTLNVTGNYTNTIRAESAGELYLNNSVINSAGTSSADTDPSSSVRALSGGKILIDNSSITALGQRGDGFSVQDTGSMVTLINTAVSVSGTRAKAAFVFDGGAAILDRSKLMSENTDAAVVQGAGSTMELFNSTIESTAVLGFGLRVSAGGAATMSGGSSTTQGRDSPALFVANANVTATDAAFRTYGNDNAIAVLADVGGTINLSGGSVVTSGDAVRASSYPHAVAARNSGAVLTATNTSILTTGYTAIGAVADDGGTVFLKGNSIKTQGDKSIGLFSVTEQVGSEFPANIFADSVIIETYGVNAHGVDSQARNDLPVELANIGIRDSDVTTHGNNAAGLRAILADYGTRPIQGRGEAIVVAYRTKVLTEGTSAYGALSRDHPTSVTMNLSSVTTTGQYGHGSVAAEGGLIIGNHSSVTAKGDLAAGLFLIGDSDAISTGIYNDSVVTNRSGATIEIAGFGDALMTDSRIYGSDYWLFVGTAADFPDLVALDPIFGIPDPDNPDAPPPGVFSPPADPIIIPGYANVILSGSTAVGAAYTASGSISNVTLKNRSIWLMTGNSNVTNLYHDGSLIEYTPPTSDTTLLASYKTLTTENYVGNNGAILINTFLDTDRSPSDLLVIDGGTETGLTGLVVQNTTGLGALTFANGIMVVQAQNGGTTDPDSFYLATPVVSGPFEYTLHRSSLDNEGEHHWYLRNLCPYGDPRCSPEPPPPGPVPPSPTRPRYRPEIGLYPVLPAMSMLYGQAILETLHQRVGQGKWPEDPVTAKDTAKRVWGRVVGLHGDRNRVNNTHLFRSADYSYNFSFMQLGGDLYKHENERGRRDHAGIYGVFGRAEANVQRPDRYLGHNQFTGLSLGGYWTMYSPKEAYIDTVLQSTWYTKVQSQSAYIGLLDTGGWGGAASIEAGYPFVVKHNWIAEPQIQAIYQKINLHSAQEIPPTVIRFTHMDSTVGRLGVRFAHKKEFDSKSKSKSKTLTTWFRPNIWYQFQGNPYAEFSSAYGFVPFQSELQGATLELNLGTTLDLPNNFSVYANGSYGVGLNLHATSYDGRLGCKIRL